MTVEIRDPDSANSFTIYVDHGNETRGSYGVNGVRLTNSFYYRLFWLVSRVWGQIECFVVNENTRQYVWLRGEEEELAKNKPYGLFRETFTGALTLTNPSSFSNEKITTMNFAFPTEKNWSRYS